MASSLAKHRYYTLVATGGAMDSVAGVTNVLRSRALTEIGEFGFGRMGLQVRFFDVHTKVCIVRVTKASARQFPGLAKNAARIVATSGSMRCCKSVATIVCEHVSNVA